VARKKSPIGADSDAASKLPPEVPGQHGDLDPHESEEGHHDQQSYCLQQRDPGCNFEP